MKCLVIAVWFLAADIAAAHAQEPIGYVHHVRGDWVLESSPGAFLSEGTVVPAGGVIRPAASSGAGERGRIVVVLVDGRRLECPNSEACAGGRLVLDVEPRADASWARRVVGAVAGYFRQPARPLVPLSARGGGTLQEGVLLLADGTVDLTPILAGLDPGEYRFCFRRMPDDAADHQGVRACGAPFSVSWRAGSVPHAPLATGPGLYALVRDDVRVEAESWVLAATEPLFEVSRAAFDDARRIIDDWGPAVPVGEKRVFLRAFLWTLADELNPPPRPVGCPPDGPLPEDPDACPEARGALRQAHSLSDQAADLVDAGRYDEALALHVEERELLESHFGDNHPVTAQASNNIAWLHDRLGRAELAEQEYHRALHSIGAWFGADHPDGDYILENLVRHYRARGRQNDVAQALERLVALYERTHGAFSEPAVRAGVELADAYANLGHLDEAEDGYERFLSLHGSTAWVTDADAARVLRSMGQVAVNRDEPARSGELFRRALAIADALDPPDDALLIEILAGAAGAGLLSGDFTDMVAHAERAFALSSRARGADDVRTQVAQLLLGMVLLVTGRDTESAAMLEPMYDWLRVRRDEFPTEFNMAEAMLSMALARVGRLAEGESLARAVIERVDAGELPADQAVSVALSTLIIVNSMRGRLEEAERAADRVAALAEAGVSNRMETVGHLQMLSHVLTMQGRLADAESMLLRALRLIGDDTHPFAQELARDLGRLYFKQARYPEAVAVLEAALQDGDELRVRDGAYRTSARFLLELARLQTGEPDALQRLEEFLAVAEHTLGRDHPTVLAVMAVLTGAHFEAGRVEEFDRLARRALELGEATLGPEHPTVVLVLQLLYVGSAGQERQGEIRALVEERTRRLDSGRLGPEVAARLILLRGGIRWEDGDLDGAISDFEETLRLVEDLRVSASSDDEVRALYLDQFATGYDALVGAHLQAGDTAAAFDYLQRGRTRGLLDKLAAAGLDLRQGIAPALRDSLETEERAVQLDVVRYRQALARTRASEWTVDERLAQLELFQDSLNAAEREFHRISGEIRRASPLWNQAITRGGASVPLMDVQRTLVPQDGALLAYQIGLDDSRVFVLSAGAPPAVHALVVDSSAAHALGVAAGPLTRHTLGHALLGAPAGDGTSPEPGLLTRLARPPRAAGLADAGLVDALHALWETLMPVEIRDRVLASAEVVIVPDHGLNLLPFEALVVESGEDWARTRFWLDAGTVLRYAPSLASLHAIANAESALANGAGRHGVLSLSHPIYDHASAASPRSAGMLMERSQRTRSMFARAAGPLDELAYTASETDAIRTAVAGRRTGSSLAVLQRGDATERNLRAALARHRYIHIATHGLVDEAKSALFAALALAPPATSATTPDDDGFLELHEIYDLNLAGVDLVVLSACDTNVGRLLGGEGVFALSRGFLAAGARRVVASQWAVADESTAALIGRFFTELFAEGEPDTGAYPRALNDARLELRHDPRWAHPYFWAPFILTGAK